MSEVDYWDEECELRGKPDPWSKRYEDYVAFCSDFDKRPRWEDIKELQLLDSDVIITDTACPINLYPYKMEWDIPEWPLLSRKRELNEVADFLADALCTNPRLARQVLGFKPKMCRFSLKAFIKDLLLLDKAKEGNGMCEYFFSFAFLSPKAIKERRERTDAIGPLSSMRWPFASPGGVLREALLSFLLFLVSIGLILMFYSYGLNQAYFMAGLILTWLGLIGIFLIKNTIESWYKDSLWGVLPSPYPRYFKNRSLRYKALRKSPIKPGLNRGLVFYIFYFSNFF